MDGASKDVCRLVNEEKLRCKDQSWHWGVQVLRVRRMLGVTVSPQVNFSLESLITKSASKGFVSSVFSHVRYQIAALRKWFAANHALVGLLSCKKMVINKLISNLDSSTDALTCVYVRVLLHVRFLVEPFTAKVARIRSGVAVNQEMGWKCAAPLESFTALWTLKIINIVRKY